MRKILAITFLSAALFLGCNRAARQPEPLTVEEVPAALTAAFTGAADGLRQQAESVARNVESGSLPAASIQLNALSSFPSLTEPQRSVTFRAMMAVNERLQHQVNPDEAAPASPKPGASPAAPAEAQDAAAAAAALQFYQSTK